MATPAPNPQDSAPYEDRRAFPRVAVAMPAFLQAKGARHAVQLLDLSAGGAKLNCSARLPTGTAVVLDCGSLCRSAMVRWQTGGVLGICFDSELDAREVTALIARSVALDSLMKARGPAD
jgi:PilZ domain-containing protein